MRRMLSLPLIALAAAVACDDQQITPPPSLGAIAGDGVARDLPSVIVWRAPQPPPWTESDAVLVEAIRRVDGRVLIGFKPPDAPRARETGVVPAMTAAFLEWAREQLAAEGVEIRQAFNRVAAVAATISPERAPDLARLPFVDHLEPEGVFRLASQTTPWGVDSIHAPPVWTMPHGSRGAGRAVRIIDVGMDTTHADLQRAGGVQLECWAVSGWGSCQDTIGHGTKVAGVAFARDNTIGVVGVANTPKVMGVYRACNGSLCAAEYVVEALQAIMATEDPGIVNMSFGQVDSAGGYPETLVEAIARAYQTDGHLLVAAAGNDGGEQQYPARDPNVLGVAGTNRSGLPSTAGVCGGLRTSYGDSLAVGAPFDSIYTTALGDQYATDCGTSFSAPHVAGVAALLWTHLDSLGTGFNTAAYVRQRLLETAVVPAGWDSRYGRGRVDAWRALTVGIVATSPCDSIVAKNTACTFTADSITRQNGSVSYAWERQQCPGCPQWDAVGTGAQYVDTLSPTSDPAQDPYRVRVTVTDTWGLTGTDTVVVRTLHPPLGVAITSPCDSIETPGTVCTFSAGSVTGNHGPVSYAWSQRTCDTCGSAGIGTNSATYVDTLSPVYDSLYDPYQVRVTVTDTLGLTGGDTLAVRTLHPPPTPLFAEIFGPDSIPANTTCLWTASVAYGVPPYSYRWYRDKNPTPVSTSEFYYGSATTAFTLRLLVWDQQPDTLVDVKNVGIAPGFCPLKPGGPGGGAP